MTDKDKNVDSQPQPAAKKKAVEVVNAAGMVESKPHAKDIVQSPPPIGTVAAGADEQAHDQAPPLPDTLMKPKADEGIIYPKYYDTFDESAITVASDKLRECEKGGSIAFLTHRTASGKPSNLYFQTPPMVTPSGIKTFDDGKSSMMLSLGNNFQSSPSMVSLTRLIDKIETRVAKLILEKGWARIPGKPDPTLEGVCAILTHNISEGTNTKTGEKYTAAIPVTVNLAQKNAQTRVTTFFAPFIDPTTKVDTGALCPATAADVTPRATLICIIEIPWIFRKTVKGDFLFSIHMRAHQVSIEIGSDTEKDWPSIMRS